MPTHDHETFNAFFIKRLNKPRPSRKFSQPFPFKQRSQANIPPDENAFRLLSLHPKKKKIILSRLTRPQY